MTKTQAINVAIVKGLARAAANGYTRLGDIAIAIKVDLECDGFTIIKKRKKRKK